MANWDHKYKGFSCKLHGKGAEGNIRTQSELSLPLACADRLMEQDFLSKMERTATASCGQLFSGPSWHLKICQQNLAFCEQLFHGCRESASFLRLS